VKAHTATIRELRTDFRSVKRRIEAHGAVVITDRGEPAFLLSPLRPPSPAKPAPLPDYMGRMLRRQPRPLSDEETRRLWEEERGER
jgi:antitoxin (DNA-binding transcriptional repressor) of toxin-antitoxin stability system